jgi:hypothetical protein
VNAPAGKGKGKASGNHNAVEGKVMVKAKVREWVRRKEKVTSPRVDYFVGIASSMVTIWQHVPKHGGVSIVEKLDI